MATGGASRRGGPVPADVVLGPVSVVAVLGLAVAGIVVVTGLARAWYVLELLVTSAALAALVRRLAAPLRRAVPSGVAVALVSLGAVMGLLAIGVAGYHDLSDQTSGLAEVVRAQLARLDPASALGDAMARADLPRRVADQVASLPGRLVVGGGGVGAGLRTGSTVIVVIVLTLFWVGGGPRLRRAALDRTADRERRDRLAQISAVAYRAGAAYVWRTLALAAVTGAAVGVGARLVDVPGAMVLGLWAGLWSVVPAVGLAVGVVPLLGLATALGRGPVRVGLLVVAAVVLAVVVRAARRRLIEARTVTVGPLLTTVALVLGLQLAGLTGGLVLLVAMAVGAAGLAELERSTDEAPWEALAPADDDVAPRHAASVRIRWRGEGDELALRLPLRSMVWLFAGLVALAAAWRLVHVVPEVFVWLVIAGVLSLALHRVVRWVAGRTHAPAPVAVAAVVALLLVALGGLLVLAGPPAVSTFRGLPERLPRVLRDLQDLPVLGPVLRRNDAAANVERFVADAPDRLVNDTAAVRRVGLSLGDSLVAALSIVLLTVAGLLDGPRIVGHVDAAVPRRQRRAARRAGAIVYDVIGRYAAGSATVALLNGTVVTVLGLVAGVPMAPVLGVWAALWNFVPQVGGLVGAAPLVLFATMESTTAGLVCLGGFLLYQNLENHVIQPAIVGKAVDVSPLATLAAVLIGGALAGFPGALLATPMVGAAKLAFARSRPEPPADRTDDGTS